MKKMTRFHHLDAARGLLAIGVVASHCKLSGYFPWYWGVMDFFFVLSGFLITRALLMLREDGRGFGTFIIYRMCRLLPVFVVVLLATELFVYVINAGLLVDRWVNKIEGGFSFYYLSLIQNLDRLYSVEELFPRGIALDHFWSLVIEEQFYLIWGALFFFYLKGSESLSIKFLLACLLLVLLSVCARFFGVHWWLLIARCDGFILGSLMGLFVFGNYTMPGFILKIYTVMKWPMLFCSLFWLLCFANLHALYLEQPAGYKAAWLDVSCFSVVSAGLVYWIYRYDIVTHEIGRLGAALAYLGGISYEIYVVHFLVIVLLAQQDVSRHITGLADESGVVLYPVALIISIFLAWIMNKTLTKPSLRSREQVRSNIILALQWSRSFISLSK